jgi:hypothetical protein
MGMGLYIGPLGIGIRRFVCCSQAQWSTEPLSQYPFLDSFGSGVLGSLYEERSNTFRLVESPRTAKL